MKGHIPQKGDRFYVAIYEGLDPVTGRERRRWHPAGTDRAEAERLAARLPAEQQGRADAVRALTFGAYLTRDWLPGKKLQLATSTYNGYERNVERHIGPVLGRIRPRRLRYPQIEAFYDQLLNRGRRRLGAVAQDRLRHPPPHPRISHRGRATRVGQPQRRARRPLATPQGDQQTEGRSWTDEQLRQFLRAAAGHRFFPILWLAAMTGMRRNEVLGLKWSDIDLKKRRLSVNRGLVAVGYELHQTRGKTKTSHRTIDLDGTTVAVLKGWRAFQTAEIAAVGIGHDDEWVFTDGDGDPIHPHALSQAFERIAHNAEVPLIRLYDLRHTHGSLLIKEGVPVKGRKRTAWSRQYRLHDPDLSAPATRHASRRRPRLRTTHHPVSTGDRRIGGTPEEPPEEDRLTR